jgi:uncharacterized protein YdhG (YjbR/CyaY superfamily)
VALDQEGEITFRRTEYAFSPATVDAVGGHLPDFDLTKGTIRFTADQPLPADVVRELARLRVAEIEATSSEHTTAVASRSATCVHAP